MNKKTSEIVGIIETYLKEAQGSTPEEIGIHITKMLIELSMVSDLFSIEVVPLKDSYILRTRNLYTSDILGAMPGFCKICGKLLGKTACTH
jgi:hypothetical protein